MPLNATSLLTLDLCATHLPTPPRHAPTLSGRAVKRFRIAPTALNTTCRYTTAHTARKARKSPHMVPTDVRPAQALRLTAPTIPKCVEIV